MEPSRDHGLTFDMLMNYELLYTNTQASFTLRVEFSRARARFPNSGSPVPELSLIGLWKELGEPRGERRLFSPALGLVQTLYIVQGSEILGIALF